MQITTITPARPASQDRSGLMYVRSYLFIRLLIGFLGWSLPFVVVLGALWLGDTEPWRGSLSSYYHSGMRDFFVGSLCATGVFLLSYMAFERNWDNVLSVVAGVSALGVALLPTSGGETLTPVQRALGETLVGRMHFASAAIFILSLAGICWMFGNREATRPDRTPEQHRRGRLLHHGCAAVIVLAVVYVLVAAVASLPGWVDDRALFLGETIAVIAFGVSWFVKGTELRLLLGPNPDQGVEDAVESEVEGT